MLVGTGANATGVQTHHLLGNVQDATTCAKEARDKGNVAAIDLCTLCNLREMRGYVLLAKNDISGKL